MSHNYRKTTDECGGCGATEHDRSRNKPHEPQGLSECPHCGEDKCCMCDMGDDVYCGNCPTDDEGDDQI